MRPVTVGATLMQHPGRQLCVAIMQQCLMCQIGGSLSVYYVLYDYTQDMLNANCSNGASMMVHASVSTPVFDDGASETTITRLTCNCSADDAVTIGSSNGGCNDCGSSCCCTASLL